jgi:MarR family transcriptional regulator, organic hydroperoxide resistance regulator
MSKEKQQELFAALVKEIRRFIANSILFNQQVAERMGINLTDQQVLNLLDLMGKASPGELAKLTHLTTGGVTVALDRLEKAGFIRRQRNPNDRRGIIVLPIPARQRQIQTYYRSINDQLAKLFAAYKPEELKLIHGFFKTSNSFRA